jgi:CubicO group peptidase (beta-lactamase class C family)
MSFPSAAVSVPSAIGYRLLAIRLAICHLSLGLSAAATPPDIALQQQMPAVESIIHDAMKQYGLKAIIVAVNSGGQNIYTEAAGESMTGVGATVPMHFRNGAMAFTYISTMLLELVDQKKVSLDTKLSAFLPDLPNADRITLKNLANMTSGYADYVYQPELTHALYLDPFRQWSSDELIRIGTSKPMMFEPGTN